MKKFLAVVFLVFILSSCLGSKEESSWSSIHKKYEWVDFSMTIPAKWEILKNTNKTLPKPADWEIVLASVSDTSNNWFYRNILILKHDIIDYNLSSLDFIIWNYIWAEKEFFYIKKLWYTSIKINYINTKIYFFEARYSEDTPILKFLQTWIICNKNGYIITIALEKNNRDIERYKRLMGSFKCRDINLNSDWKLEK